ncbi:VOC family protein [Pseudoalteromonas sp. SSDWG2]|uniref:VOC family protein n=1 Tax=Pseudoalteromonas sp. SSDWG2 TaxID=3139391 RepID=UPI003BAB753F
MTSEVPLLRGVDHCHIQVDDVEAALVFYRDVLGFDIVSELEFWYHEQEGGPLMLQDKGKTICLALFKGNKRSNGIAFGCDASQFVRWREHLAQQGVDVHLADHQVSYSMYFRDPCGNMHEITCFDYHGLAQRL